MQALPGFSAPLNAPVARVVGPTSTPSPQDPGQSFFYDGRGHLIAQRYHDAHQSAGAQVTTGGLAGPSLELLPWIWERRFTWNAQGRLDSVRVEGVSASDEVSRYWYGPGGTRIAERATPLATEPDPTWTQSRRWGGVRTVEPELEAPRFTLNVTLGSTVVAQKTVEPSAHGGPPTETMRFLGGDHLGSASIVTDEHGDLVRGVRYEPYGRIRDEWGPEANADDYAIASTDELFNGKPRNRKAFGLTGVMGGDYALEGYDYGARIYLPELSRWASADSITPDTVWEANAFAYVRNNPLKYVDPDGHFAGPAMQYAARLAFLEALKAAGKSAAVNEGGAATALLAALFLGGPEEVMQPATKGQSSVSATIALPDEHGNLWEQQADGMWEITFSKRGAPGNLGDRSFGPPERRSGSGAIDRSDRNMVQDLLSIKKQKGPGDIVAGTREEAELLGEGWVNGSNAKRFDLDHGGYGLTDGTRTFRLQWKKKSGTWKANFQENIHVEGRKKGIEVKNIHMTISDMEPPE